MYDEFFQRLTAEHYWDYTAEHSFYRYDKNADGSGKFSNKKVKIFAFQKADHDQWVEEKRIKEEMEKKIKEEMEAAERKKAEDRAKKAEKEANKKAKK